MEERVTDRRPDRERGRERPSRDPRTFYLLSVVYGTYKERRVTGWRRDGIETIPERMERGDR